MLADAVFDIIDLDGDNEITVLELRKHLDGTGYSASSVDDIFRALDLNCNGAISREEMRAGFSRYSYKALALALRMDLDGGVSS